MRPARLSQGRLKTNATQGPIKRARRLKSRRTSWRDVHADARAEGKLAMDPMPEAPPSPSGDWYLVDDGSARPAPCGFIHVGVTKEFYGVLQDLGADPEAFIAQAGLDPCL